MEPREDSVVQIHRSDSIRSALCRNHGCGRDRYVAAVILRKYRIVGRIRGIFDEQFAASPADRYDPGAGHLADCVYAFYGVSFWRFGDWLIAAGAVHQGYFRLYL